MENIQMLNESYESEALKEIIQDEKKSMQFIKSDFGKMKQQKKIMTLQNHILPCVQRSTVILYDELVKYFLRAIDKAIDNECNDLILILNLSEQKDEVRRIGTCVPGGGSGIELAADFAQKVEEVSL